MVERLTLEASASPLDKTQRLVCTASCNGFHIEWKTGGFVVPWLLEYPK